MMRTSEPILIDAPSIAAAWADAVRAALSTSNGHCGPLVLSISVAEDGVVEDPTLRIRLDNELLRHQGVSIDDNAFMIFPYRTWERLGRPPRSVLFKRYERMLPQIRARSKKNVYGTYFGRMIGFEGSSTGEIITVNQLERILTVWERDRSNGTHTRTSALQLALFDPPKDHSGQPQRGFPCLQQISISYDDSNGLALHAMYPTQLLFERAYGNYLGLAQLGTFIAHEMKLRLARLNVFITSPTLSMTSGVTRNLMSELAAAA